MAEDFNKTSKNPEIKVDEILKSLIENNKTPSAQYIIFDKDKIIHKFHNGFSDINNQKKVDKNTTYNVFSVTKTFTALAVLQLAEKGHFIIDDSVKLHLPDFPYSSDITIRQLMTHSSGIPNPNPLSWIHLAKEHQFFDRNKFFNQIFKKNNKTISKPNEKFRYSNLGYVLLGQLIEKVSGQSYEAYVRDHIIKPLEINPTELDFEIFDTTQYAKGYQKKLSLLNWISGIFIDKSTYMNKAEGKWKPYKNFYVNGTPHGGLIGSPNAFVKYLQELLKPNCRLLSDDFKQMLFTENFTNNNIATGMCLSWFKYQLNGQKYFAHAGGGGGYYCEIRIYPKIGIGSVIMFNRTGITDEHFLNKLDKYYIRN